MNIKLENEIVKIKTIQHPGFNYANEFDHPDVKERKVCKFGRDKVALVGDNGAFFGKEPQYVEFNSTHKFSCLTVFKTREAAKTFVEFLNWKIKAQIEMSWLEVE